ASDLSPSAVRHRFAHALEPADRLLEMLTPFPSGLLRLWLAAPGGHVVFTHRPTAYRPEPQLYHREMLEGVCFVALSDLMQDQEAVLLALTSLLDHLMGGGASSGGPYFSDGHGVTPALAEAAGRFVRIHDLGYGHDELGVHSARDYFAHTLRLYLRDERRLNVLDPQVQRLYRHTLMSEAFWEREDALSFTF
ncbi:MAG TPA: hypothetical protein GX702_12890, partial [Chloroflexi bacterium]|nr:hypothetical protein [Chloroflexota bacterium]